MALERARLARVGALVLLLTIIVLAGAALAVVFLSRFTIPHADRVFELLCLVLATCFGLIAAAMAPQVMRAARGLRGAGQPRLFHGAAAAAGTAGRASSISSSLKDVSHAASQHTAALVALQAVNVAATCAAVGVMWGWALRPHLRPAWAMGLTVAVAAGTGIAAGGLELFQRFRAAHARLCTREEGEAASKGTSLEAAAGFHLPGGAAAAEEDGAGDSLVTADECMMPPAPRSASLGLGAGAAAWAPDDVDGDASQEAAAAAAPAAVADASVKRALASLNLAKPDPSADAFGSAAPRIPASARSGPQPRLSVEAVAMLVACAVTGRDPRELLRELQCMGSARQAADD